MRLIFEVTRYIRIESLSLSLMLRPTVSRPAPIWGLRPDLYYLCDSYGLVLVGRSL
jgi:hypothetical protein